MALVEARC